MGVSGQLYHLPLPSEAEPVAMDVDLLDGPASGTGNTSATTFAGKVVGDSITELLDIELCGLKLIAGSPISSWALASIVTDLKGTTSRVCYGNF
jgi:hypothetical protein